MSETTFENAKVGDRVWDTGLGWGIIDHISNENGEIVVEFEGVKFHRFYNYKGILEGIEHNQTLFWDEIKITPPPRPKRKVVKTVEKWVNVYNGPIIKTAGMYESKERADLAADAERIACVKLTGTYEVEE